MYFLSPHRKIFSSHGLIHYGIINQILQGNIPPTTPFLAYEKLNYPWMHHALAAGLSKLANISPSNAMAAINVICLNITGLFFYKTSTLIYRKKTAQICSTILALYGCTIWPYLLLTTKLHDIGIQFESRSFLLLKFFNVNGCPLGLASVSVFLYFLLLYFRRPDRTIPSKSKAALVLVGLFSSTCLCGLFYPAMIPGVGAIITCTTAYIFIAQQRKPLLSMLNSLLPLLVFTAAMICILPYIRHISSSLSLKSVLFENETIFVKILSCFFFTAPFLILIFYFRKKLQNNYNTNTMIILAIAVAAPMVMFIFMSMPYGTEYKSFLISLAALGIIAGGVFERFFKKSNKVVFILLFLICTQRHMLTVYNRASKFRPPGHGTGAIEIAGGVMPENKHQRELISWVTANTEPESVLIDNTWDMATYGKRKILVAPSKHKLRGIGMDFLGITCGYDQQLIDSRRNFVKAIYDGSTDIDFSCLDRLPQDVPLYVIYRPYESLKTTDQTNEQPPISNDDAALNAPYLNMTAL